ncbi:nuclear transport factor 2 family protein [Nocardia sp. NBC_01377]|uniref:nuclear transport factor 2 family protein n=1 Tax=Nocardia sp. NBC_01377 TaxID=2903595 RepID=UPI003243ABAF
MTANSELSESRRGDEADSEYSTTLDELLARVRRLEDEAAINRLIMTYGPAADAGLTSFAGGLWLEDGLYDWDADGQPYQGSAEVDTMLQADLHQSLIAAGVAHFAGPLLIDLQGDEATVLNYSLIMRREEDRSFLWRVSAVRWEVARTDNGWRVRRRTNRLLDATGGGLRLFRDSLTELFEDVTQ